MNRGLLRVLLDSLVNPEYQEPISPFTSHKVHNNSCKGYIERLPQPRWTLVRPLSVCAKMQDILPARQTQLLT